MDEARILTDRAEVPLAALYLSDPGAVTMIAAWLHGAIKASEARMTTYQTHGRAIARKTGQKSDYILRSEEGRDRARTLTGCLFCSWSLEGPAGEAREASLEHRRSHHPDRPLRLKRRGGKLVRAA